MKKLLIWISFIIIVAFVLSVAKDAIIKFSVENGVRHVTGLPLRIRELKVGILSSRVIVRGLYVYNPPGFRDAIMVDIPEIYVACQPLDMLKKVLHLTEVRFNLKELAVVKNEQGDVNIKSLKTMKQSATDKTPAPSEEQKPAKALPAIHIDVLRLTVGRALYKDYSKDPHSPTINEFPVNINDEYRNITNVNALVGLIVFKTLAKTTIGSLASIDLTPLKNAAANTVAVAKEAAQKAGEVATETAQKAATVTKETLKKTTEGLKRLLPGSGQ